MNAYLEHALAEQQVEMKGLAGSSYVDWNAGNGEAYRLFIGRPVQPFFGQPNPATAYPVIHVLDGKLYFASVHAQVQLLSAMRLMPPAYVVGIGYAGDEDFFGKDAMRRQADFTPNAGGAQEAEVKAMNLAAGIVHGGARAFLDVLTAEVRPALARAFAIDDADATLIGHSLGGLFASWVLFNQPDTFRRYLLLSPSWWWNEYELWRWEQDWADGHEDLVASVFACFGGLETAAEHRKIALHALALASGEGKAAIEATIARADERGWMQGAELIPRFQATLAGRAYPGLRLASAVMPGEIHETIPAVAFARGLRAVFAD